MQLTFDYLRECGFEVDVEMNLSSHFFKDDSFELINFEGMDFERDCDWELIIFGLKDKSYGGVRLIAHTDDLDKIKTLLTLFDIDPNKYFK